MSTAEQKPNPVTELVQLFRRHPDSFTLCVFHYEKALFRLSADQIRHYLTMEDDALLFLLSRMQPDGCEFNPAWWYGWRVLIQAMGEWPDLQVFSCNKRLFWKLVLRHANLLCTAGSDLFQAAASMCKALLSPPEATSKVIYDLTQFGRVACNVACFFLMLLMETNKAEHARFMADVLRSFNDFFMSADSVLTTHWSGNKEISEPLLLARKHGSVLIERMVAAVPADCWDDDVARSILSHACALMDGLAKQMPSRSPQELLHCTLVTMAGERVTFCKTYVERTEKDEPANALIRAVILLLFKLPEEQLRRVIDKRVLQAMMSVRACASGAGSYTIPAPQRVCFASGCGKHGESLKVCKGCHIAEYCSGECQRNDWLTHKPMCLHWRQQDHD